MDYISDVRVAVSDENDMNEEMKLKRSIFSKILLQKRHMKKKLVQVKQK